MPADLRLVAHGYGVRAANVDYKAERGDKERRIRYLEALGLGRLGRQMDNLILRIRLFYVV